MSEQEIIDKSRVMFEAGILVEQRLRNTITDAYVAPGVEDKWQLFLAGVKAGYALRG